MRKTPYTNQSAFNKMVKHLRKQGKKCFKRNTGDFESTVCLYRHKGLMCAVGVLIDDDDYSPDMEENNIASVLENFSIPYFNNLDLTLLTSVQEIHDFTDLDEWEVELEKVAKEFNLTLPKQKEKK